MKEEIVIHWFRRDLRLIDNVALYYALTSGYKVLPLFIFDKNILDLLEDKEDRRVSFIYSTLEKLNAQLQKQGSGIWGEYGFPDLVWERLINIFTIKAVYTNHDYEPYARNRDESVQDFLQEKGIPFHTFKDQVIFEKQEIVKADGSPYTVFTPYKNKWMAQLQAFPISTYPSESLKANFLSIPSMPFPTLEKMGFIPNQDTVPGDNIPVEIIQKYAEQRDFPGISGTTRLSVHLRFGTLSIRQLALIGKEHCQTWLNELIWREFYMMILWWFPQVTEKAFKPAYDRIPWRSNPNHLTAWQEGKTGYPLVDAGMRELKATGFMHNRVRMVVASFLTKHLLMDWRIGEAWFARHLLDFDLAANNGGWQWAASSGCDAVPYFRIFNPRLQAERFDPQNAYIQKWIPEWNTPDYPKPIVTHEVATRLAIETFKSALSSSS